MTVPILLQWCEGCPKRGLPAHWTSAPMRPRKRRACCAGCFIAYHGTRRTP